MQSEEKKGAAAEGGRGVLGCPEVRPDWAQRELSSSQGGAGGLSYASSLELTGKKS